LTLIPLLLSALLAAAPSKPATGEGPAAFERLKKLSGAWRAKDSQTLTLRLVAGGSAVLETRSAGPEQTLGAVTVYRLEGGELVAVRDGARHSELRLASASGEQLVFVDKAGGTTLTLSTASSDSLQVALVFRSDAGEAGGGGTFVREYVDTLK
jgi:hypothetical protein